MRELIGIRFSPWTEKALWALEHHKLPYQYHEHMFLFGMPYLRWKLWHFSGDVTVPALIDDHNVSESDEPERMIDSWNIALHADELRNETVEAKSLFPEEHLERIRYFNDLSEQALCCGRGMMVEKMSQNPEALKDMLPSFIPKSLRGMFLPMGKLVLGYIRYGFDLKKKTFEEYEAGFRSVLLQVRDAMNRGKNGYLLDRFSYADITIAVILQYVEPVADQYIRLTPALRECWGNREFAKDFFDLVEWRNRIYRKHRV